MISKEVWARNGWEKVRICYDRPLQNMPYAQAGVMVEDKQIVLVSYTTPVIWLWTDKQGHACVDCSGLYSVTTRKHISAFLREYAPDVTFADIKRLVRETGTFDRDDKVIYPYPHE